MLYHVYLIAVIKQANPGKCLGDWRPPLRKEPFQHREAASTWQWPFEGLERQGACRPTGGMILRWQLLSLGQHADLVGNWAQASEQPVRPDLESRTLCLSHAWNSMGPVPTTRPWCWAGLWAQLS